MLNQTQAKQKFRSTLVLLLVGVLWPLIGGLIAAGLTMVGFQSTGLVILFELLVWLALFVWLFITFWQLAADLKVSPWGALWLFLPVVGVLIVSMLFIEPLKYLADGKPETKQLPRTWDLVKDSWKLYTDTFKDLAKTSLWFLYVAIVFGAIAAVASYFASSAYLIVTYFLVIPMILTNLWITLAVFKHLIALEQGDKTYSEPILNSWRTAVSYLWLGIETIVFGAGPFILVIILTTGAAILATGWPTVAAYLSDGMKPAQNATFSVYAVAIILAVGGLLMFLSWLWLIYKTVIWNSFILPLLTIEGKKGLANLKECDRLAKGKWWGLFWKKELSGIVFGSYAMLISLGMSIAVLLITAIFETLKLGQIFSAFASQALNGLIEMIILPLILAFMLKLYRAFKKTS
ncbi:MAG: hypothetical protein WC766_02765 [Patescibacteria group bacterium]|jgi:hypothetical protein